MLVRHVLSQLSYAPLPLPRLALDLSDMTYYTQEAQVCQELFLLFAENLFPFGIRVLPPIPGEIQTFSNSSATSSGVKVYTVSQNWHSTGKGFPSPRICSSSSRPRLIRAAVTRSRVQ